MIQTDWMFGWKWTVKKDNSGETAMDKINQCTVTHAKASSITL